MFAEADGTHRLTHKYNAIRNLADTTVPIMTPVHMSVCVCVCLFDNTDPSLSVIYKHLDHVTITERFHSCLTTMMAC